MRYTTRCGSPPCAHPRGNRQFVDFQCSACDAADQRCLLERIDREAVVAVARRQYERRRADAREKYMQEREQIRASWLSGRLTGRQRDRRLQVIDDGYAAVKQSLFTQYEEQLF